VHHLEARTFEQRNAVEDENLCLGMELVDHLHSLDVLLPELDGKLIGDQFAAAGIVDELLAERRPRVQRTEHIAACAMEKPWNGFDLARVCRSVLFGEMVGATAIGCTGRGCIDGRSAPLREYTP